MKRNILGLSLLFSIFVASATCANALIISEIMYDPAGSDTGNEWIEVYNETTNAIDIKTVKLFENNVNHGISESASYNNISGSILQPGEYAVIADNVNNFLNQHSGFSGKLFDSSFSLINTGELLTLKSGEQTLYSVNYIPQDLANGTGGTLNNISEEWVAYNESPSVPPSMITPSINSGSGTTTGGSNSTTTSATTSSTTTTSTSTSASYSSGYSAGTFRLGNIKMLTPREMKVSLGAEAEFFVKFIDAKDNLLNANIYWSYGDGGEGVGATTTHRYYREGYYTAFVEGVTTSSYGVEMIGVQVTTPKVIISDVGYGYIKIKNEGDENIDIGGFKISSPYGIFKLSRKLIIKPHSEIIIDGNILGFTDLGDDVRLLSAYNTFITKYIKNNNSIGLGLPASSSLSYISATTSKLTYNQAAKPKSYANKLSVSNTSTKSNSNVPAPIVGSASTFLKVQTSTQEAAKATQTVESATMNIKKNWLYWLYD